MRNRCGVRTSSVKAMERETPNDHEQLCLRSSSDCFMAVSRVVHGRKQSCSWSLGVIYSLYKSRQTKGEKQRNASVLTKKLTCF